MSFETITVDVTDGVATITLDRPEKRNALNSQLILELTSAARLAEKDPDVRVVVLTANGTHFCAGADIEWMRQSADKNYDENCEDGRQLAKLYSSYHFLSKPVIAKITGDAFGGGLGLALCGDMAVCLSSVVFAMPEVRLGIVPAVISPYVVKAMGEHYARRFMLTGEVFTADVATSKGMKHTTANDLKSLDPTVERLVKSLKAAGPNAIRECKQLIFAAAHNQINQSLVDNTVTTTARVRASAEGKEGLQSFLNKTRPSW